MDELLLQLDLQPLVNARRETIGDREYVVATAVILQPQVLSGSDGPLFYPLDEINQDVGVWNGFPLTAKHPQVVLPDGKVVNASARSPKVAHAYQIGTVYNDRMEGQQRLVDVYIDVKNANRVDSRIIPAVLSGKRINVSTGIFTGKVQNSGTHNGRTYTHRVKGIRPDHLAVLMDEAGACSVADGCGINVNADKPQYPEKCPYCGTALEIDPDSGVCNRCGKKVAPLANADLIAPIASYTVELNSSLSSTLPPEKETPTVDKTQLLNWLTTNCDCWKGDAGKVLANMTEDQLKAIKTNTEAGRTLVLTVNQLKTAGIEVTDVNKLAETIRANAMKTCPKCGATMSGGKCEKCGYVMNEKVEVPAKDEKTTTNAPAALSNDQVLNALKSLPEAEVLKLFPRLGTTVNTAEQVINEKKIEVIKALTANIKDDAERKAKVLKLKDKDLPTLNEYLEFANVQAVTQANSQSEEEKFLANFFKTGEGNKGSTGEGNGQGKTTTNEILMPYPEVDLG